ncbi:MAG: DUF2075 domain-containing protein [Betaproteobacteria bacterium]|nr:DUF2075 domain-containing protein [Betaproteobacteria bacterium]
MIVYEAVKDQFLSDSFKHDIEDIILERFMRKTGHRVGPAEVRSWRDSLQSFAKVLNDAEIPDDLGVAVELHIPQSSKRIDVVLSGIDAAGGKGAVIVELKQWETAQATCKDAIVLTHLGGGLREVVHPSYQAWSYASLLHDFNEAVYEGRIGVASCAYLHNYQRDGIIDAPQYTRYTENAPLFLKGEEERAALRGFIKQHVHRGDRGAALHEIAGGRIRPSKALADSLSAMLRGNPEFVLIDEQKEVYEAALSAARAATVKCPQVLIIDGGPGTGKSVVAINLLVALTEARLNVRYVSKNAAPREVYQSKLGRSMTRSRFSELFKGSGTFFNAPENGIDVLIVDEAHRLNEKSGLYGNLGEHQVKELIHSAKCTIFFLDEDQRVTLQDIGTKDVIRHFASRKHGATVDERELVSQFRCNGSDGFVAWLDNVLDIHETANDYLSPREFDFQVFDTPEGLHAAIEARNVGNKARVVAGYCWPWTSKKDPSAWDIKIGNTYRRRWNLDKDGSLWIVTPGSIEQVGCIHTCQGLELDYVGVIVGPDLIVHDGEIVTVPEARDRHDKSLKGWKLRAKTDPIAARAEAGRIIKNTYRTLMTRGMKGCYVYCTDEQTREHFRRHLGGV